MNQNDNACRGYETDINVESNTSLLDNDLESTKPSKVGIGEYRFDSSPSSRASSFSSVKEDTQDVSQSFVSSRSRDRLVESQSADRLKQLLTLSTSPTGHSFTDLSSIQEDALSLGGLSRQSSLFDLTSSLVAERPLASRSPLERLPVEVLEIVIEMLALDVPPQDFSPRNVDLIACLLTSKTLHAVTINILYRQITLPHSFVFSKFLNHLSSHPELGRRIRRLDLSHFTSVGLGRSQEMNSSIRNLTSDTLLRCLELAPNMKELLLQEHLDRDINEDVLRKAFYGLPKLRSLDLCACYAGSFTEAFSTALARLTHHPTLDLSIQNLSLHECFTIRSSDLELLLPRLPHLKILDLYHTRVTDTALHSIRDIAKLTHLNLGHCNNITGPLVTDFLASHPSAKNLVYLNLSCDISRYRLLRYSDMDRLLPILPSTLQSLNLGGAQLDPEIHMPDLHRLSKHLEELGLSSTNLTMADVRSFFNPLLTTSAPPSAPPYPVPPPRISTAEQQQLLQQQPCTLRFMDLTSNPTITQPSLFFDTSPQSSRIDAGTPSPTPFLLKSSTLPLEVLELSAPVLNSLKSTPQSNKRFGWLVKELGRRGWYVRERGSVDGGEGGGGGSVVERRADPAGGRKGGGRWWKMGARSWGMRKVPVCEGEVGGFYGFCMFRR